MATKPAIVAPIKRSRPVRDSLGAIADGITRTTPVMVDTVVATLDSARLLAELARITMGTALLEERLETRVMIKQLATEYGLSIDELRAIAKGTSLEDLVL